LTFEAFPHPLRSNLKSIVTPRIIGTEGPCLIEFWLDVKCIFNSFIVEVIDKFLPKNARWNLSQFFLFGAFEEPRSIISSGIELFVWLELVVNFC
jgi:hypothetical protein